MSSCKPKFWIVSSLGTLAALSTIALSACSPPGTERRSGALTVDSGVTLSSATFWTIAPGGTMTTGTVTVGSSSTVLVPIRGLSTGSGYQLIVSGVASDGVTGCSGSTTFSVPAPSAGVPVNLQCGGPGQGLVTASENICPIIDGVAADTASVNVGSSMALQVTAHDPDSGPRPLAFAWSASGGSLSTSTSATPAFTCTAPGTVTLTVTVSDGPVDCNVTQSFDVTCTEP